MQRPTHAAIEQERHTGEQALASNVYTFTMKSRSRARHATRIRNFCDHCGWSLRSSALSRQMQFISSVAEQRRVRFA